MKKITFGLIVKNEESVLDECLKSIKPVADEIVVVDTGSTDKTKEIAKRYTDKVYDFKFEGDRPEDINFAAARNEWFKYATGDLIFMIDADERLPDKCIPAVQKIKNGDYALWYVQIGSLTQVDRDACISGNYRLFPNDKRLFFKFRIHENLADVDHIYQLRNSRIMLKHLGYLDAQKVRKGTDDRNLKILLRCLGEEKNPTDLFYFKYLTAHQYGSLGMYKESLGLYQDFIEFMKQNPKNINKGYLSEAYQGLAIAALETNDDKIMESLMGVETKSPTFYIVLGHYWMNKKEYDKAVNCYDEAIMKADKAEGMMSMELSSITSKPYVAKGNAYREKGDLKRAIDCFRLAHMENPQDIGILKVLSRLYAMHGKGRFAKQIAEEVAKVKPNTQNILHLGEVYINYGEEKKGIDIYCKHGSPEIILYLAEALSNENKKMDVARKLVDFLDERKLVHGVVKKTRKDCVTVIIPTLLKCDLKKFEWTLDRLQNCEAVKEIILLKNTSEISTMCISPKVHVFNETNRYVNPAWNFGVSQCTTDYFLLLNDDCLCDGAVIDECVSVLDADKEFDIVFPKTEKEGMTIEDYDKGVIKENKNVVYVDVFRAFCLNGWFIFGRKEHWLDIPEDLKIFYGDNLIYDFCVFKHKKKIGKILSNFVYHETSTTINKLKIYQQGILEAEGKIYEKIKKNLHI